MGVAQPHVRQDADTALIRIPGTWTMSGIFYADELYETLKIDNLYFMATDGGVTFGGWEPGLYTRFIHELARKYGGRWSINMETSLNYPRENLLLLLDAVD